MRAPRLTDLVEFIVRSQPELDARAATRIVQEDPEYREWVARQWQLDRQFSDHLLTVHLLLEEKARLINNQRRETA